MRFFFKLIEVIRSRVIKVISRIKVSFLFFINNVKYERFVTLGTPLLDINSDSYVKFGTDFVMINSAKYSTLGKNNRCKFVVSKNAMLVIGNKVGMSNVVLVATKSITIGSNVMIGGGVTIVDSDFHSLNPSHWHTDADIENMVSLPVVIKDNVFIGMNTIILKGVTIGSNVVIAAGSVVSKSISDNQIWGGNPARYIKEKK